MLDLVDEALDAVAQAVGVRVVGDLGRAPPQRWDHGVDLGLGEMCSEAIVVVALVGDQADEREPVDQGEGLGRLVHLSCRQDQPKRMAEGIDGDVDLGAQAAARAADGLTLRPPCAPAACWCARTMVASIMTCSKSGSSAKALKRLSQRPLRAHRTNRM